MNNTVERKKMKKPLGIVSLLLQAALLYGVFMTGAQMIETFRLVTLHGTGDAQELSEGVSEALIYLELSVPIALLGVILSGVALWGMKLRERWFFWGLIAYSIIWLFVGGIWGIGLIICLIVKRKEFFINDKNLEPAIVHIVRKRSALS